MEIVVAVFIFFIALFLVIKGGDIFVESSAQIAKRLHIPQIIFGATIISLATTSSELVIAIVSSINDSVGLAVGNSVGSVLCNIGLTSAISFILLSANMSKGGVLKYYLNLIVFVVILVFGLFQELYLWQGIVLVALALIFFIANYIDAKTMNSNNSNNNEQKLQPLWISIIMFLSGAFCVGSGAYLLVDKVEYFSKLIGVSEQFVGLTVVAIGTSLPELITVINAIKQKSPYLAIGNIIGSNILNITLILGTARLFSKQNIPINAETAYLSLPLALIFGLVMIIPILVKKRTYKWQGFVLIILYVIYIAYLVCNAVFKIF